MLTKSLSTISRLTAGILLGFLTLAGPAVAQQVSFALLQPESITPAPLMDPVEPVTLPEASSHRFWDRGNSVLFATSAAFSAGDFYLTRANLRNNGQELNPVTRLFGRRSAGLAVNFIGQDIGVIGVSYFLHKTGHHKLERAVSMLNIGSSAAAVTFDLAHR
jgi:hypothetical protein